MANTINFLSVTSPPSGLGNVAGSRRVSVDVEGGGYGEDGEERSLGVMGLLPYLIIIDAKITSR